MKKTMRAVATTAIAAACAACVAALAPVASAADGTPLSYAQLQSDPTTVAANANISTVMQGNFTLKGAQLNSKGGVVVTETLVHKQGLYRIAATRPGLGTYVVISDGKKSCVRSVSSAAAAAPRKDASARWKCKSGVDSLLSGELLAVTPLGMAQLLDTQTSGSIGFAPTTTAAGAYQLGLMAPSGTQAGAYNLAGPATGPFQVTITQAPSNFIAGKFTVTPGASGSILPLSTLKK